MCYWHPTGCWFGLLCAFVWNLRLQHFITFCSFLPSPNSLGLWKSNICSHINNIFQQSLVTREGSILLFWKLSVINLISHILKKKSTWKCSYLSQLFEKTCSCTWEPFPHRSSCQAPHANAIAHGNVTSFHRTGLTRWHKSDEEVRLRRHVESADTLLFGADVFVVTQNVHTASPSFAIF